MTRKRSAIIVSVGISLILLIFFGMFLFRSPAYFLIGITNHSKNVFIKEVKFKNRGTEVDEHISMSTGNIRGPFPTKMTVVSQTKDGSTREQDFDVARHAPWNCHTLEIRVMEDDVVRLLFVTYSEGDDDSSGISYYDPLEPKSESQRVELETQMCEAAKRGDIDTIRKLLDAGVSPNARIFGAYVPALEWAALFGHLDIVKLLLDRGATVDNAIIRAAEKLDSEILDLMVKQGGDVNLLYDYKTPVYYAIDAGNAENVRWLIEHGVQVDQVLDGPECPPITWAVYCNAKLVPLLLELGADLSVRTLEKQQTPLEVAIESRMKTPDFEPERQAELDIAIEALKKAEAKNPRHDEKEDSRVSPPKP